MLHSTGIMQAAAKGQRFVSYLRVSTERQGRSGLGLEAQRASVSTYIKGAAGHLSAEMVEIESGCGTLNRPKLADAFALCRLTGAALVVAKLDRLSRDAHFLTGLLRSDVEFVSADMPHANRMTVGIMAIIAEGEREAISLRTREALAAAKARGKVLGGYRGVPPPDAAIAAAARTAKADRFAAQVGPVIRELRASGMGLQAVARALTAQGVKTARGGGWTANTVKNVLARGEDRP